MTGIRSRSNLPDFLFSGAGQGTLPRKCIVEFLRRKMGKIVNIFCSGPRPGSCPNKGERIPSRSRPGPPSISMPRPKWPISVIINNIAKTVSGGWNNHFPESFFQTFTCSMPAMSPTNTRAAPFSFCPLYAPGGIESIVYFHPGFFPVYIFLTAMATPVVPIPTWRAISARGRPSSRYR